MSKAERMFKKARGATMVEYALLIVAVMLLAAVAYRKLGSKVSEAADKSTSELEKKQ
jgi:Flp pilus assembly pilin Flp